MVRVAFDFYEDYRLVVEGLERRLDSLLHEKRIEEQNFLKEEMERQRLQLEKKQEQERQALEKKLSSEKDELYKHLEPFYRFLIKYNIINNKYTSLPLYIDTLMDSTDLEICFNNIDTLPESVGYLTHLQKLNIRNNKITALPDSICNLTNLESLNLSNNPLGKLPNNIGKLTKLKNLNLKNTLLTEIPESINHLKNLDSKSLLEIESQRQNMLYNKLLFWIKENDIAFSYNEDVNEKIKNTSRFKTRKYGVNPEKYVTEVPETINLFKNLKILDVSNCDIKTLPDSICDLTKLKEIFIPNNPNIRFSESIYKLKDMTLFEIDSTQAKNLGSIFPARKKTQEQSIFLIRNKDNKKYGIINNQNLVIPIEYDEIYGYSEGTVMALKKKEYRDSITYFTKNGHQIIYMEETWRDESSSFSDGVAIATQNTIRGGYKFCCFNKVGKILFTLSAFNMFGRRKYESIGKFKNGRARVLSGNFQTGFIDKKGKIVIPFSDRGAGDFSEGLAAVGYEEGIGYINTEGSIIIAPQYQSDREKFTKAMKSYHKGFFLHGYAIVPQGHMFGVIDKSNNALISFTYHSILRIDGKPELLAVEKDGLWGVIDIKGNIITEIQYASYYQLEAEEVLSILRIG